ncbi:MAG: response regulator [Chitinophagaceae bacterium]
MENEKIKILLVEDDAINYSRVKTFLEKEGYEVLQQPDVPIIDNYDDAVALCARQIPHIAILDIQIKGERDGLDIGAYIRDNYQCPVIFLSGHNNEENLRRTARIGADGFVVKLGKPLRLVQLKTDLLRLVPRALQVYSERKESGWFYLRDLNSNGGFYKIRLQWNNIHTITTRDAPRNSILITTIDGKRYVSHQSLSEFMLELPSYIIRYSNSDAVNARLFNRKGKSIWINYIDEKRFEISEPFRNEEIADLLKALHS